MRGRSSVQGARVGRGRGSRSPLTAVALFSAAGAPSCLAVPLSWCWSNLKICSRAAPTEEVALALAANFARQSVPRLGTAASHATSAMLSKAIRQAGNPSSNYAPIPVLRNQPQRLENRDWLAISIFDKTGAKGPQPPLSSERNPVAATSPTNELPHREDGAFRNW